MQVGSVPVWGPSSYVFLLNAAVSDPASQLCIKTALSAAVFLEQ